MKFGFLVSFLLILNFQAFSLESPDDTNVPIPDIMNLDEVSRALRFEQWKNKTFTRHIKVAILDIGFRNWGDEIGKSLPTNTTYEDGPVTAANRVEKIPYHGTIMAKVFAEVIKKSGAKLDYELKLFNAYGWNKFKFAVETVIKEKFDVVLYAGTAETSGNSDTKGFMNAIVKEAVFNNIIWINATNEFGGHMRRVKINPVQENGVDWVAFKDKEGKTTSNAPIMCNAPKGEKCILDLKAIWSDFTDNPDVGTKNDLDLYLTDAKGDVIASSERIQKLERDRTTPNATIIPWENFKIPVEPGLYNAKLKIKSPDFTADKYFLRLLAQGKYVEILEPEYDETLFPPADNLYVITIGASDDPDSGRSKEWKRPHIRLPSLLKTKNDKPWFSSSIASAIGSVLTTLYLGTGTPSNRPILIEKLLEYDPTHKQPKASPTPTPTAAVATKKRTTTLAPVRRPVAISAPCWPRARLGVGYPPQLNALLRDGAIPALYNGHTVLVIHPSYAAARRLLPPHPSVYKYITPEGVMEFSVEEIYQGLPRDYYMLYAGTPQICN